MITWVSSISNPFVIVPEDALASNEVLGRIAHVSEFAILALLVGRAFNEDWIAKRRLVAKALVVCIVFAVFDELHQRIVPERSFQFFDLGLDSVGIVLGLVGYLFLLSRMQKNN